MDRNIYDFTNQEPWRGDIGLRASLSSYSRPRMKFPVAASSSPWPPGDFTQKPSFNLYFNGDFGPGKLDYGYTHAASGHMAMELFKQTAGLFMTGIPYRGGGPMLTDLLAGTVPLIFLNQDVVYQHVKSGKLRALAVTSAQRNPLYPDVPTVAESGYKGFEALSWSGLSVAKGTPQPIVDKLQAAVNQVVQSDVIRQKLNSTGFVVPAPGSQHYTAFVKSELELWTRVIKAAGIKADN